MRSHHKHGKLCDSKVMIIYGIILTSITTDVAGQYESKCPACKLSANYRKSCKEAATHRLLSRFY